MSHDELPPDAKPPRSEDAAASSEQDPSNRDAPPAKPARHHRAKTAGSDAASMSESKPAAITTRSTRRRAAKTEASDLIAAAAEPAVPVETPKKTTRRRATTTPAPETPHEEAAAQQTPALAPETLAATQIPPRSARRTRRTKSAESAPPPAAAAAETPAAVTPEPPGAPQAETRRRRGRSKQPASIAPEEAAAPQPAVEAAAEIETPAAVETAPSAERQARRQRTSRGRKKPQAQEPEIAEAPPAETIAQEPAGAVEAPQMEPTPEKRTRRNRRGGRSRRGETRSETIDTEPNAQTAVAAAAAEAVYEQPIDLSLGAHLVTREGAPTLYINGVIYPPVLFFGNMGENKNVPHVLSEVRRAARAGVHLHSILVELPCPLSEASQALDEIDANLRTLLDADPEGYVMPRIVFLPARGWKREYPTEISAYADGTTGDPALTSDRFWRECERSLEALIAHINNQIWGSRVFGYHLERGEWFQPADLGFDRSMANRDAFRDWLREKYHHNLVALRAAWYDGDVQFHTAEIPTIPAKPNLQRAFYETRRERCLIDFNEFTSESTARRLIALARTVKKATSNNALASLCYGYTFEFGHGFSGHLALDLVLAEKSIDLICGPPSYRDRKPGGAASYPAPVDSPPLHGKLWLSEDDTKTYLAPTHQEPDDFNPRLGDRFQTEQAQMRAIGKALVHNTAIDWMDLWGEGWLEDDGAWERIGAFTAYTQAKPQPRRAPEVVALIDEKSLLHIQRGELFFRRLTSGLRDTLQRSGVSFGAYLQSDLLSPNFPTEAKLYLFLTPYRLTSAQRTAIKEKLQRDNKTLAWLYAPGACEERPSLGGAMEETATGAIGLALRQQEWNSEIGSRVTDTSHLVTERLNSRDIGARERLNPSFYVDDPGATVLAEYHGSGLPSLAVKNLGNWKTVFVGDPVLPLELLRGICRYAGVHLWTPGGEDVLAAGEGWIMLHAARDGQRTLRLPVPAALYDLSDRRLLAREEREHRFFLRTGNTRLFYTGTIDQMQRLGLPNLSDAEHPSPTPADETPELAIALPEPVLNSDLETLKAVLSMQMPDDVELELKEEEFLDIPISGPRSAPTATLEEVLGSAGLGNNGRKRRRRGGRGRGRRKNATDEPTEEPDPPHRETL